MKTLTPFEKLAQKSRRHQRWMAVCFSLLLGVLLFGLTSKALTEMASHQARSYEKDYRLKNEIAYPNISYQDYTYTPTSRFAGLFVSNRFKDLDGIKVPYEPKQAYYSIGRVTADSNDYLSIGDSGKSAYTRQNLYKSPIFYNRRLTYKNDDGFQKTNDLTLMSQLPNQVAEVAITFDKDYSYREIAKMIPDNVNIVFYWIGVDGQYDTAGLAPDNQLGMPVFERIPVEQSFKVFLKGMKSNLVENSRLAELTNSSNNTKYDERDVISNYLKHNTGLQKAYFAGVLLTGKTENLAKLKDKDWIFAANIGQSAEIMPYHKLIK